MNDELRRLKDEAARALEKGKYRKAGDLYARLGSLAAHERDPQWVQRAGEAYRRAGARDEALAHLGDAASQYARLGFLLKAIAVCKAILEIDPAHRVTQELLASLYARGAAPAVVSVGAVAADVIRAETGDAAGGPSAGVPPSRPAAPGGGALPASTATRDVDAPTRGASAMVPPLTPTLAALAGARATPARSPAAPPDTAPPAPTAPRRADADSPFASDGDDGDDDAQAAAFAEAYAARLLAGARSDPPAATLPARSPSADPADVTDAARFDEDDDAEPTATFSVARLDAPARPAFDPSASAAGTPARPAAAGGPLDSIRLNTFLPDAHASTEFPGTEVPLDDVDDLLRDAKPALPWLPLFSSLDEEHLRQLIERCEHRVCAAGEVIVRQGEDGDSLFVIVHGLVQLSAHVDGGTHDLGQIGDGSFFGELAVLTASRRMATVTAVTDTELLAISQEVIGELVEGSPEVMRTLLGFFRERMVQRLMTTSPLFQAFPPEEAEELAARFQFLELEPGALLLTAGQRTTGLFLIVSGACDVLDPAPAGAASDGGRPVGVLGPGDIVGALSLLHPTAERATVRARTQVWVLAMSRAVFGEVIQTHPQVLIYVNEAADRRDRRRDRAVDLY